MKLTAAVRAGRKATSQELSSGFSPTVHLKDVIYSIRIALASELDKVEREAIYVLTEANMRDMAVQSSTGWDPSQKKKELFHQHSRFVIIYRIPEDVQSDSSTSHTLVDHIVAFAMFRFEAERGEDIIYCYELQLWPSVRRSGLGRFIMNTLVQLGAKYNMKRVKLTVLKANTPALAFYHAIGFTLDPTSPDYVDEQDPVPEECDYQILSKGI
ncbi:unnamed protein product [Somion occarium]|uniref:N-alpha-acetyltransferase 40 n=1 Tax=Somion occarium TaxID=3059160 RepID=A0ABP1CIA5_9APHY